MSTLVPSYPPNATATQRGLLSPEAQEIGGPKTFLDDTTVKDTLIASGDWSHEFLEDPEDLESDVITVTGLPLHIGGFGGDIAELLSTPGFRRYRIEEEDENVFLVGTPQLGLMFNEAEDTARFVGVNEVQVSDLDASGTVIAVAADVGDLTVTNVNGAPYIASPITAVDSTTGVEIDGTTLKGKAATGSVWGVLTVVGQQIAGVKTFLDGLAALDATIQNLLQAGSVAITTTLSAGVSTLSSVVTALVRAVGASLVLRSSLGATSGDVVVKVGPETSDGTTHDTTKLVSIRTGVGGTEVEKAYVLKSGAWQARAIANTSSVPLAEYYAGATPLARLLVSPTLGGGVWYLGQNGGIGDDSTLRVYFDPLGVRGGSVSIIGRSGVSVAAIGAILGTDRTQPDAARSASMRNGTVEVAAVRCSGRIDQAGKAYSVVGNDTVNKPIGIATIAAGSSDVVITNSLVTANSHIIFSQIYGRDATCKELYAAPFDTGGGVWAILIAGTAPASNDLSVAWEVKGIL